MNSLRKRDVGTTKKEVMNASEREKGRKNNYLDKTLMV